MTKAASRPRSRSPLKGPRIETAGSLVGVLVGIPMGLWVIGCLQSNYNPGYLHQIIFIDYNALASILSKDCECSATLSPTELHSSCSAALSAAAFVFATVFSTFVRVASDATCVSVALALRVPARYLTKYVPRMFAYRFMT